MTHRIKIRVIHGPNLNLLGQRESKIYGDVTLQQVNEELKALARAEHIHVDVFQSNHEGALIDSIQQAIQHDGILINPAAYTHTSIAIRDALLAISKPFVEVHLSDLNKREKFRQHSYLSDIACAVFSGTGAQSYYDGFKKLVDFLKNENGK